MNKRNKKAGYRAKAQPANRNQSIPYKEACLQLGRPLSSSRSYKEKKSYLLEDFDRSPLPGTYVGNRLKKFVEREGFYEAVEPNKYLPKEDEEGEEDKAEPEREEGVGSNIKKGVTIDSENRKENLEYLPMDFEILLPELGEDQRGEYMEYTGEE